MPNPAPTFISQANQCSFDNWREKKFARRKVKNYDLSYKYGETKTCDTRKENNMASHAKWLSLVHLFLLSELRWASSAFNLFLVHEKTTSSLQRISFFSTSGSQVIQMRSEYGFTPYPVNYYSTADWSICLWRQQTSSDRTRTEQIFTPRVILIVQ